MFLESAITGVSLIACSAAAVALGKPFVVSTIRKTFTNYLPTFRAERSEAEKNAVVETVRKVAMLCVLLPTALIGAFVPCSRTIVLPILHGMCLVSRYQVATSAPAQLTAFAAAFAMNPKSVLGIILCL